jgi:hypothetical protein
MLFPEANFAVMEDIELLAPHSQARYLLLGVLQGVHILT